MSARKMPHDVVDRSRGGHLVHDATSSGRTVTVVAYVEGAVPGFVFGAKYAIESTVTCRTPEQAQAVAETLREAHYLRALFAAVVDLRNMEVDGNYAKADIVNGQAVVDKVVADLGGYGSRTKP